VTSLRVSEVYPSYQGEGPNTGKPTVFVRFAGCNLKCPGWPCDTPHAIEPKIFTKEQKIMSPEELVIEVCRHGIENICLTGGEPFLQNRGALIAFVSELRRRGLRIECFTNGTINWGSLVDHIHHFIMDWKLPGSGEYPDEQSVLNNFNTLGENDAVKFTVKHLEDLHRAVEIWNRYVVKRSVQVYCGVVFGAELTERALAEHMLHRLLPWSLNVQVHKYIWPSDERGV
jgi:7-carboxy-7-deazaguanine synthase